MIPRPGNSRPYNSRLDNLISWFAASIIVTAGVIYGLKLQEDRGKSKPERALARATPAQEPLTWQERRAAERRGRVLLRAVRRRCHHRQASLDRRGHRSGRFARHAR